MNVRLLRMLNLLFVLLSVDIVEKVLAFPETNIYAIRFSRFSSTEIQIFREPTYGHETLNFEIFSCVS